MRDLCEGPDPAAIMREAEGERIGALEDVLANTPEHKRDARRPWLLAPNDLQAIKAAGVTFPLSMLERVIEEQARGSPEKAAAIRTSVATNLGGDIRKLVPGSAQAAELKRVLIAQGAWSQYLEVGIGPDAEIFTKAQPMSAVGPRHGGRPAPDFDLEQSRAGSRAGGELQGRDRRRNARQRRQSPRRGGPLRAAAVEGQGQQCFDRHRTVRALLRWRLHARYGAPHRRQPQGRGRGRLRARGTLVDGGDRARSGRSGASR